MNYIGKIIFSLGLWASSLFGFHQPQTNTIVGSAFTPVQASQFTLAGSGITSSQTTVTLTSFKLPDPTKTPITMSMFGDIGYAVIEPQTSRIENITFTGVSQNANGTAVLTGVKRGISFYSPYQASSTLALSHSGGAYLILTNSAAFYGQQFLFANNTGTSTATVVLASTSPWRYDYDLSQAQWNALPTTTIPDMAWVNRLLTTGCANSSETVDGCVQLSTTAQAGAGTSNGSTGARLVIPGSMTSSASSATTLIPVTSASGKLSQGFLDLTASWAFTGNFSLAGTVANPFTLNTVAYSFPTGQQASSSILTTNGSGALTWERQGFRTLFATSSNIRITSGASTTLASFTIPANVIAQGNELKIDVSAWNTFDAKCGYNVQFGSGQASSTYAFGYAEGGNTSGNITDIHVSIFATSTTGQVGSGESFTPQIYAVGNNFSSGAQMLNQVGNESFAMASTGTTNLANQSYVSILGSVYAGGSTGACYLNGVTIGLLAQ